MNPEVVVTLNHGTSFERVLHLNGFLLCGNNVSVFYDSDDPCIAEGSRTIKPNSDEYESLSEVVNSFLGFYLGDWFKGAKLIEVQAGKLILSVKK
jgi:hypothetical protein